MFIFDERFLRTLSGAAMGGFEKETKERNHFHDIPLNPEGEGKWGKRRRTSGNGEGKKMKYHRGLNNVKPCGKRSPRAALIAFISISFMASSLLSCCAMGTPSR